MKKNRDRLSLIAAILEVAQTDANKTKIMYMANLSFQLLEKYLMLTLNVSFLQQKGSMYEITEKGRRFLKNFNSFHERRCEVQKMMKDLSEERKLLERLCQASDIEHPNQSFSDSSIS